MCKVNQNPESIQISKYMYNEEFPMSHMMIYIAEEKAEYITTDSLSLLCIRYHFLSLPFTPYTHFDSKFTHNIRRSYFRLT